MRGSRTRPGARLKAAAATTADRVMCDWSDHERGGVPSSPWVRPGHAIWAFQEVDGAGLPSCIGELCSMRRQSWLRSLKLAQASKRSIPHGRCHSPHLQTVQAGVKPTLCRPWRHLCSGRGGFSQLEPPWGCERVQMPCSQPKWP